MEIRCNVALILFLVMFWTRASCITPELETTETNTDGQPTNPCAAVLCAPNSFCFSRPDPTRPCYPHAYMTPDSCPQVAVCVPNGPQSHPETGISCPSPGDPNQVCKPGEECKLQTLFCPVNVTCHPQPTCVPYAQPGVRPN